MVTWAGILALAFGRFMSVLLDTRALCDNHAQVTQGLFWEGKSKFMKH